MDRLTKQARIGTYYEEKLDGKLVKHQRQLSLIEKLARPAVEL